jgi:hypothetical protein
VFAETVSEITGATGSRAGTKRVATTRLAIEPDEPTGHSDQRLRRADIDSFERGLRTRRAVGLGGAAAVALAIAGVAAWFLMRQPPVLSQEREPNDELAHANPIAPGHAVTGYLGRRRSRAEGDRDVFQVRWPKGGDGRRVVTARVTGLPNVGLNLTLLSDTGGVLATSDDGALGEAVVLHRRAVEGALLVEVGQAAGVTVTALPIENVSDAYTLTVTDEGEDPGAEHEPNNGEADATVLASGRELRGYLDTRKDVDVLRLEGDAGTYAVVVRGDGLPLVWRGPDDKARSPGAADLVLRRGDVIRLERRDREAPGPLVGQDAPWSVTVTKR